MWHFYEAQNRSTLGGQLSWSIAYAASPGCFTNTCRCCWTDKSKIQKVRALCLQKKSTWNIFLQNHPVSSPTAFPIFFYYPSAKVRCLQLPVDRTSSYSRWSTHAFYHYTLKNIILYYFNRSLIYALDFVICKFMISNTFYFSSKGRQ